MRAALILGLLCSGCGGGDDDTDGLSTTTGTTTGSTTTSTTEPTTFTVDTACSTILPVDQMGRTFEYLSGLQDVVWTDSVTFTGQEDYFGEQAWRVDLVRVVDASNGIFTNYASTWYRCDADGVWQLGYQEWTDGGTGGTTSGSTAFFYAERAIQPGLVAPPDADVGSAWTYEALIEEIDASGNPDGPSYGVVSEYDVLAAVRVELQAGTFDALSLQYDGLYGVENDDVVHGLGRVRYSHLELVDYEL